MKRNSVICFTLLLLSTALSPVMAFQEKLDYQRFRLGTSRIGQVYLLNPYWNDDLDHLAVNARRKVIIKRRNKLFEMLIGIGKEVKPGERLEVAPEDYPLVYQQVHDRIGDKWEIQGENGVHFRGRLTGFLLHRTKIDRGVLHGLRMFALITPEREFSPAEKESPRQSFYNLVGFANRRTKPKITDFQLIDKVSVPKSLIPFWIKNEIYTKLNIKDKHTTLKYRFWHDGRQDDKNYYLSFTIREFADPESHRGLYKASLAESAEKIALSSPVIPSSHSNHDGCLDLYPENRFTFKTGRGKKDMYILSCNCYKGEYSMIVELTPKDYKVICYSEDIKSWKRNW
ncbi:MAG: hypothetical protein ACE5GM_10380 [bacterium]